jgi:hypothetical protein
MLVMGVLLVVGDATPGLDMRTAALLGGRRFVVANAEGGAA